MNNINDLRIGIVGFTNHVGLPLSILDLNRNNAQYLISFLYIINKNYEL